MKVAAAFVALAALAFAAPEKLDKRDVNPASATASLLAVLPSSILNVAITNPAAATTLIEQAFATGTPAWFTSLPAEVQTYFLTQVGAGPATATASVTSGASAPITTGSGSSNTTAPTGKYSNSTTTSGSSKTSTSGTSATGSSGARSSSSSTGAASMPTALIGGGLAGLVGLVGMLAL